MSKSSTKKRLVTACGVAGVVVMAAAMTSIGFIVCGKKFSHAESKFADFDLVDASFKLINSTETNIDPVVYNLTVTILGTNPNKDMYTINFVNGEGTAVYANRVFANKTQLRPAVGVAEPSKGAALHAVFEGTIPEVKLDTSDREALRIYDFSMTVLVQEFVTKAGEGYHSGGNAGLNNKRVEQASYQISCDFEVGLMSDPTLSSPFHQAAKCSYTRVSG